MMVPIHKKSSLKKSLESACSGCTLGAALPRCLMPVPAGGSVDSKSLPVSWSSIIAFFVQIWSRCFIRQAFRKQFPGNPACFKYSRQSSCNLILPLLPAGIIMENQSNLNDKKIPFMQPLQAQVIASQVKSEANFSTVSALVVLYKSWARSNLAIEPMMTVGFWCHVVQISELTFSFVRNPCYWEGGPQLWVYYYTLMNQVQWENRNLVIKTFHAFDEEQASCCWIRNMVRPLQPLK